MIFSKVLATPIFSISSYVFLIPAVSTSLKSMPLIVIISSIVSLVVPAMEETIALFSFTVTFIIMKFLKLTIGVRISSEDEEAGIDASSFGVQSYNNE